MFLVFYYYCYDEMRVDYNLTFKRKRKKQLRDINLNLITEMSYAVNLKKNNRQANHKMFWIILQRHNVFVVSYCLSS